MRRSLLVASLPHGPQDPVRSTPPRRLGSVRRTTSIDQRRGDPGEPTEVVASGRDLRTEPDGRTRVLDEVRLRATIDSQGAVVAIDADPPVPALQALVGAHGKGGFRARVAEELPEVVEAERVLLQLLDDVPMAALISSYGWTRELGDDWDMPAGAADRLRDLCAGWIHDGTMLEAMEATGTFPIPLGPPAPDLDASDDPLAWHDAGPMTRRSVRRRRRIDVVDGDPLVVDVHFRDSHLGLEGPEDVLHEYLLAATVDPANLVVLHSEAEARTLPWPECPGAAASAGRVVGEPLGDLRPKVLAELRGTSTCTHLNDVLRSLAGVAALVP